MSSYIPSSIYKTAVPQGESERLTAFPILAPGSNTFWGASRVQAARIAEHMESQDERIAELERKLDERDRLIAALAK